MTEAEYHDKAIRQANEDLRDIGELKDSEPFNRYWLRRLKAKRDTMHNSFLNDPPSSVDKDEREHLRRIMLFCNELLAMMEQDASSAKKLLDRGQA